MSTPLKIDTTPDDVLPVVKTTHAPTKNVSRLFTAAKDIVADYGTLSAGTIIMIMVDLMKIVDTYPNLNGSQKKQLVLEVLNLVIDELPMSEDEQEGLKQLVEKTLPTVIDVVIDIDKKKLKIKIQKCCNILCSYF